MAVSNGRVAAYAQEVGACALGSASASIFARAVVGRGTDEIRTLRETVARMLKEEGAPPDGVWADYALLQPARVLENRHRSMLLCLDATVAALDQAEAGMRDSA